MKGRHLEADLLIVQDSMSLRPSYKEGQRISSLSKKLPLFSTSARQH